jgi:hypothetical protein
MNVSGRCLAWEIWTQATQLSTVEGSDAPACLVPVGVRQRRFIRTGGLTLRVFSGLSSLMMYGVEGAEGGRQVMEARVEIWEMKVKAVEARRVPSPGREPSEASTPLVCIRRGRWSESGLPTACGICAMGRAERVRNGDPSGWIPTISPRSPRRDL